MTIGGGNYVMLPVPSNIMKELRELAHRKGVFHRHLGVLLLTEGMVHEQAIKDTDGHASSKYVREFRNRYKVGDDGKYSVRDAEVVL